MEMLEITNSNQVKSTVESITQRLSSRRKNTNERRLHQGDITFKQQYRKINK
jgi:hypothetical protein